jgi:hypothetical protein
MLWPDTSGNNPIYSSTSCKALYEITRSGGLNSPSVNSTIISHPDCYSPMVSYRPVVIHTSLPTSPQTVRLVTSTAANKSTTALTQITPEQPCWPSEVAYSVSLAPKPAANDALILNRKRRRKKKDRATARCCAICKITTTPEWRRGPNGPAT